MDDVLRTREKAHGGVSYRGAGSLGGDAVLAFRLDIIPVAPALIRPDNNDRRCAPFHLAVYSTPAKYPAVLHYISSRLRPRRPFFICYTRLRRHWYALHTDAEFYLIPLYLLHAPSYCDIADCTARPRCYHPTTYHTTYRACLPPWLYLPAYRERCCC